MAQMGTNGAQAVEGVADADTAAVEEIAAERGFRVPGAGFEPACPTWGHLVLSQARLASFATPAGTA
jgi:hypothetical protein